MGGVIMNTKGRKYYFLFGLYTHSLYMLTFLIMSTSANTEISLNSLGSNKLIIRKMEAKFNWHKIRLVLKIFIDKNTTGIMCYSK